MRRLFTHISIAVYSQVLIYTAEWTGSSWRERKCLNFETVAKGIRTKALSIENQTFYHWATALQYVNREELCWVFVRLGEHVTQSVDNLSNMQKSCSYTTIHLKKISSLPLNKATFNGLSTAETEILLSTRWMPKSTVKLQHKAAL